MLKNYTSLQSAIVFLVLSIACILAYNASGQYIDSDGVLHEQFGLIPLGWMSFILSSGFAIYHLIRQICKK